MSDVAYAQRIYPTGYAFSLNANELSHYENQPAFSSIHAERLHFVIENITLVPFKACQRGYAHMCNPFPGKNKDAPPWQKIAVRACAFFLFVIMLAPAIASVLISMGLRLFSHGYRPVIQYVKDPLAPQVALPRLSKENPLVVTTLNASSTPTHWVNVSNDMRDPCERALELAESIIAQGDKISDLIMMQEIGWNEDAAKIFLGRIAQARIFRHILCDIMPGYGGMGCGYIVLSKHAFQKVHFERFTEMTWQHQMPPRGILSVEINTEAGPVCLYNLHTQSLYGGQRAEVRKLQLAQLKRRVDLDKQAKPQVHQVMMGDLNTTRVDDRGVPDPIESQVVDQLQQDFRDHFLNDHHPNGQRKPESQPYYLPLDNVRMELPNLSEPSGSWVYGCCSEIEDPTLTFGTERWFFEQRMDTSRLDYILTPQQTQLEIAVEIRRVAHGKASDRNRPHSPPTDHGMVTGRIYIP